eukprot:TRINITY_DN27597_c0_g1_i1.p1 TRINITY_DN27597_c0_g1~~TRINITY_DN27597_c0_g1_i1.p1  ORF type:complete len:239 (+),score=70.87 TRINITY_DN27597_c0_g1_i1:66-782(+)
MDPKDMNFYGHCAATVLFIAALVLGKSFAGYAVLVTLMVSINTIRITFGMPQIDSGSLSFSRWRECLVPVQVWLGRVIHTSEMHFLMFNVIWLSFPMGSELLVGGVLLRRALWSACTAASKRYADNGAWQAVLPYWQKLKASEMAVLQQCASFEIYLALLCVVRAVLGAGLQALMLLYVHMSFLRMTYHSDRSAPTKPAALHHRAWAALDQRTAPLFRAVPFLSMPIDIVRKWFLRVQ